MALEVSELSRHVSSFSGTRSKTTSGSDGGTLPPPESKTTRKTNLHHRWLGWLRNSRCSRNSGSVLGDKFGRLSESVSSSTEREEIERLSISVSNDPWKPVFTTKVPIHSEFLSLAMDNRKIYSQNEPESPTCLPFHSPLLPLKNIEIGTSKRVPVLNGRSEKREEEEEEARESSEEGSCCFSDVAETVQLVTNCEEDVGIHEDNLTSPSSSKSTPVRKIASIKSPFLERATNKFSSPFRRFRSGDHHQHTAGGHSSGSSTTSSSSSTCSTSNENTNKPSSSPRSMTELAILEDRKSLRFTREELLRLYVLKLDEEANYFKTNSPEEEFCNCPKCQNYYCEYYSQYLDEFEQRRKLIGPIEASVLMDDMLNNGMTFCSIM
ncbi:uncharacterized protein [Lepeophtheirus salmonis]|uniref:uncharacterized protein isoform X2 n=1 Tax=Lepeophtheirus salmonis TaxID=72036 RepID=UPI003AF3DC4C